MQVDQWLHWHHHNTRQVQLAYCMPIMRPDLVEKGLWNQSSVLRAQQGLQALDRQLAHSKFVAGAQFTLADIQIYQDVGQCQPQYLDAFDFETFPNVVRWLRQVEQTADFGYVDGILKKVSSFYRKPAPKQAKL